MKPIDHDVRMTEVYGQVYQDLYAFTPVQMRFADAIIRKNLAESGIDVDDLRRMTIFNIGTGREAVAFHRLGARRIYHRDISPRSVNAIKALQTTDPAYRTISTRQMDVCDGTDWQVDEPVDFVYLNGVFHHLHDGAAAVRQMRTILKPGGRCFFRVYRSGCLAFYVVDALRKILRYEDHDAVTEAFFQRYPESQFQIYMGLYDDFFVPVLRLYDPNAVNAYLVLAGFRVSVPQSFVTYDHADTRVSGQAVSLFYEWGNPGEVTPFDEPFPPHIDQLTDITYREPHIRTTNDLMRAFISEAPNLDRRGVIDTALTLHEQGQLYRLRHEVRSEDVHGALQATLKLALAQSGRVASAE